MNEVCSSSSYYVVKWYFNIRQCREFLFFIMHSLEEHLRVPKSSILSSNSKYFRCECLKNLWIYVTWFLIHCLRKENVYPFNAKPLWFTTIYVRL